MKQNSRLVILASVVMAVLVLFLTIRNDNRFNNDRIVKVSGIASRDSIKCEQMDSIIATMNKVAIKMDSIDNYKKEYEEIVISDMDTIKQLLKYIGRTERQILNSVK